MKKTIIALVLLVIVLAVSACGDTDATNQSEVEQPRVSKFDVQIDFEYIGNLMFSKYDVDILVDDIEIGNLDHGVDGTFMVELEEGEHTLSVEKEDDSSVDGNVKFNVSGDSTLRYRISSSNDQVEIEDAEVEEVVASVEESSTEKDTSEEIESSEETSSAEKDNVEPEIVENLTVDNNDELLVVLSKDSDYDTYTDFAKKYEGQIIEFDGRIDYVVNHEDYDTRYDILVSAGDFDPNSQTGPTFKFEDVAAFDLDLETLFLEDIIKVGENVRITAEVDSFNSNTGIFFLEPVSVVLR